MWSSIRDFVNEMGLSVPKRSLNLLKLPGAERFSRLELEGERVTFTTKEAEACANVGAICQLEGHLSDANPGVEELQIVREELWVARDRSIVHLAKYDTLVVSSGRATDDRDIASACVQALQSEALSWYQQYGVFIKAVLSLKVRFPDAMSPVLSARTCNQEVGTNTVALRGSTENLIQSVAEERARVVGLADAEMSHFHSVVFWLFVASKAPATEPVGTFADEVPVRTLRYCH